MEFSLREMRESGPVSSVNQKPVLLRSASIDMLQVILGGVRIGRRWRVRVG